MDIVKIQSAITKIIEEIGKQCDLLDELGEAKAQALVDYEKTLAIATLKLKGEHPVTIMDKIVKGECVEQLYNKIVSESKYKVCVIKIEARKAQLNAFQSLYKHQETV